MDEILCYDCDEPCEKDNFMYEGEVLCEDCYAQALVLDEESGKTELNDLIVSYELWDQKTPLYHGSKVDLGIGSTILPAFKVGVGRNWSKVNSGQYTHATSNLDTAQYYAKTSAGDGVPCVYEVTPADPSELLMVRNLQMDENEEPSFEYRSVSGFVVKARRDIKQDKQTNMLTKERTIRLSVETGSQTQTQNREFS